MSVVTKKLKHFWAEQCRAEVAFSSSRVRPGPNSERRPTRQITSSRPAIAFSSFERQTDGRDVASFSHLSGGGLSKTAEASCTRKNVDDLSISGETPPFICYLC